MAKADKIETTVVKTEVVLTLTQEEADRLRGVLGCTSSRVLDRLGLASIWCALEPHTEAPEDFSEDESLPRIVLGGFE